MDLVVVLVTASDADVAARIARTLVVERLAACGNIVPGLRSVYAWEGEVKVDDEVLLVLKTRPERVADLTRRVVELHPYDLPEVVALPVQGGHAPYLAWVGASVDPATPS